MTLQEYKKLFVTGAPPNFHMNNAGLAPVMSVAKDEVVRWANRFYQEGFASDSDYMSQMGVARFNLAQLLDCKKEEVAFFQSTSWGVSLFAFGIGLKEGDEVLMWDQEYSSLLYPWQEACKRANANLRLLESPKSLATPIEQLVEAISEKTKVVAISWIQFQTGAQTDIYTLGEICFQKGIYFFVDVMQGAGLYPLSFQKSKASAFAGGSHKWLTSPVGVGYLAVREDLLSKVRPLAIGSSTYGSCDDPSDLTCVPKSTAEKYEAGSKQVLEIVALGKSIEVILQVKPEVLKVEALRLSRNLAQGLLDIGYELSSPNSEIGMSAFVNVLVPEKKMKNDKSEILKRLQSHCKAHHLLLPLRGPGIRISPHAFNSDNDIQWTLNCFKSFLR